MEEKKKKKKIKKLHVSVQLPAANAYPVILVFVYTFVSIFLHPDNNV